MKKLLILILFIVGVSSMPLHAQSFEQIVKKYEQVKGAESMDIPGFLMKMVMTFANDEKEGMSEEEKKFMKRISSMVILDMSECSQADKLKFAEDMKHISIDGFEAIDTKEMTTSRVFFREGDKKSELVIALYDGENYTLMLMRGKFDEEAALGYASTKQEDND